MSSVGLRPAARSAGGISRCRFRLVALDELLVLLLLVPAPALAGSNAGGVLAVHSAGITYKEVTECGRGTVPDSCGAIVSEIDDATPDSLRVWKVYAVFPPGSSPRLKGLTFGVSYDDVYGDSTGVVVSGYGPCAGFQLAMSGWPAAGTGTSLLWDTAQTGLLTECYWFAGYNYYGNPTAFALTPHPEQGGYFADDGVPSRLDPIAGYGTLGFGVPGHVPCSAAPQDTTAQLAWSLGVSGDSTFATTLEENEFAAGGALQNSLFPVSSVLLRYYHAFLPPGPLPKDSSEFSHLRKFLGYERLGVNPDGSLSAPQPLMGDSTSVNAIDPGGHLMHVQITRTAMKGEGRGFAETDLAIARSRVSGRLQKFIASPTGATGVLRMVSPRDIFDRRTYLVNVSAPDNPKPLGCLIELEYSLLGTRVAGIHFVYPPRFERGPGGTPTTCRLEVLSDAGDLVFASDWRQEDEDRPDAPTLDASGRWVFYEPHVKGGLRVIDTVSGEDYALGGLLSGDFYFSPDAKYVLVVGSRTSFYSLADPAQPVKEWERKFFEDGDFTHLGHARVSVGGALTAIIGQPKESGSRRRIVIVLDRTGRTRYKPPVSGDEPNAIQIIGEDWLFIGMQYDQRDLFFNPYLTTKRVRLYHIPSSN